MEEDIRSRLISMPEAFLLWKLKRLVFLSLMENSFNRSGCVSHGCKWLKEFLENFASDSWKSNSRARSLTKLQLNASNNSIALHVCHSRGSDECKQHKKLKCWWLSSLLLATGNWLFLFRIHFCCLRTEPSERVSIVELHSTARGGGEIWFCLAIEQKRLLRLEQKD